MNKSKGERLLQELYDNPEEFRNNGKTCQLLQEYFNGFSLETLRDLLHSKEQPLRMVGVWILSELGEDGSCLFEDIIPLLDEDNRYIRYHVLEIISVCATGENTIKFVNILPYMECGDEVIRNLVMRLVSNTDRLTFKIIANTIKQNDSRLKLHYEGISKLVDIEKVSPEQVILMLNDNEKLNRKYGVIMAKKLYKKYPSIIHEYVDSEDLDISRFSKEVIEVFSD